MSLSETSFEPDREQGLDFLTSPLRAASWMGLAIAAKVKAKAMARVAAEHDALEERAGRGGWPGSGSDFLLLG
jgi:hypothetical protein